MRPPFHFNSNALVVYLVHCCYYFVDDFVLEVHQFSDVLGVHIQLQCCDYQLQH